MAPSTILIIGNGVAGPTLASFLLLSSLPASEKPQITILERSSNPRSQGQNVDVRGAGAAVIRKLGLMKTIKASVTGEEGARFVDKDNQIWSEGAADKSGKIQTGTSDIEILRGRLAEIMYQKCQSISDEVRKKGGKGVEWTLGDYTETIEQNGDKVHVTLKKSGTKQSYDIVVGADGLQSKTRNLVWGERDEQERMKKLGMYAGFFSMPSASTDSDWRRWFHAPGRKGIMIRPSDRRDKVTVLMTVIPPVTDESRYLDAAMDGRKGVQAQKAIMKETFVDEGWECDRVIKEMEKTDDFYYDMVAQVKMDSWSKGRVVLLGDAGYCASPISGMGTTISLTGAYHLAGSILQHTSSSGVLDCPSAFNQYEEKMRPVVQKAQKLPPGAPHMMYPETAWGVWILRCLAYCIWKSNIQNLVFRFAGPPANEVSINEDYGLKTLPESDPS